MKNLALLQKFASLNQILRRKQLGSVGASLGLKQGRRQLNLTMPFQIYDYYRRIEEITYMIKKIILILIPLMMCTSYSYAIKTIPANEEIDTLMATSRYYYNTIGVALTEELPLFFHNATKLSANVGLIMIPDASNEVNFMSGSGTIINAGTLDNPRYLLISAGHNFTNSNPPQKLLIYNYDGFNYTRTSPSRNPKMAINYISGLAKTITLTQESLRYPYAKYNPRYFVSYKSDNKLLPIEDYLVIRLTKAEGEKLLGEGTSLNDFIINDDLNFKEPLKFNNDEEFYIQFGSAGLEPTYGKIDSEKFFWAESNTTRIDYLAPIQAGRTTYSRIAGTSGDSGGGLYRCINFGVSCQLIAIDAAKHIENDTYRTIYSRINTPQFLALFNRAINFVEQ